MWNEKGINDMRKIKLINDIIWFLVFALSIFILFVLPNEYSQAIWVTLIFDVIAFVSQLFLWHITFQKPTGTEGVFNRYPIMVTSSMYLIIQMLICIAVSMPTIFISFKQALIVNFVVMIIAWIILLLLILSKDHVEKLRVRQKDHHIEL